MVAMLGWIMPAPLATPANLTLIPLWVNSAETSLDRVSVVRMVLAKELSAPAPAWAVAIRLGRAAIIFSTGRGTPMMPVEEGKTCIGFVRMARATCWHTALAALMPDAPVAQFAFPALTISAWTFPLEARRFSR